MTDAARTYSAAPGKKEGDEEGRNSPGKRNQDKEKYQESPAARDRGRNTSRHVSRVKMRVPTGGGRAGAQGF